MVLQGHCLVVSRLYASSPCRAGGGWVQQDGHELITRGPAQ